MKKNTLQNAALALFFAQAMLLISCQKFNDYIHKPGNGKDVSDICQVQTITCDGQWGPSSYVFNYNKRNDLESIITTPVGDGNPNLFFVYDKKHRVSEVRYSFVSDPATPAWQYDKFEYNKADQIVRDSTVIPSVPFLSVAVLKYDAYGRVIASEDSVWAYGNFEAVYKYGYKYDQHGNLLYQVRQYLGSWTSWPPPSDTFRLAPYDDKISIRQTNKIWMFIDRNYSINNSLSGATYNNYGLPVNFDGNQYLQGLVTMIPFLYGKATAHYQCDGKGNYK